MPIRVAAFLFLTTLVHAQVVSLGGQAGANNNPAASNNRYKVNGTVVNAVTNEPIPRALVSGTGLNNGPVFTDASGKFEVENIPEGVAFFSAQRPGFFPQGMSQGGYVQPINSNSVVDASHTTVQVKLIPASTIHGRITDSDNQPVDAIRVQLIGRTMQNGVFRWQPRNSTNTDETGSFTFSELMPGSYILRAAARRLYLGNADLVIDGQHYPDLYSAAYFPGVPDRSSAQTVALTAGTSAEADIRIRLVATYSVNGTAGMGIRANVGCTDESGEFTSGNSVIDPRTGTFHLTGVPPGPCTLKARTFTSQGRGGAIAELPVNITSDDVSGVSLVFHDPLPNIPIVISGIPSDQKTPPLNLSLVPAGDQPDDHMGFQNQPHINNAFKPDGTTEYSIQNPTPGSFRLTAFASGNMCVASMQAGGVDLMKENLVISNDSAPAQIEVALRSDCASVKMSIENSPNRMTPVLMVGGASPPRLVYVGTKLVLSSLSPGDYTLYALTDIGNLEYGKPEVLKKLSGQQITLAPADKATVQLKLQTPPVDVAQ